MIGQPRDAPATPALILDLPRVERNLAEMARRMAPLPAALRPHAKIHKSPILGRMQLDAGAIGLTTATIWEASAMIDAGLTDVLIANQAVGPIKAAELARLAGHRQPDGGRRERGQRRPSSRRPPRRAGSEIDAIVEVDVGLHRSGVRSVAGGARRWPLESSAGPGCGCGACSATRATACSSPTARCASRSAGRRTTSLLEVVDAFEAHGLCDRDRRRRAVSGTWDITGANPRITEIHAGSYIFSDAFHRNLGPGSTPRSPCSRR